MRRLTKELIYFEMITSQLKEYANLLHIDLGNAFKKKDIADIIWEKVKIFVEKENK